MINETKKVYKIAIIDTQDTAFLKFYIKSLIKISEKNNVTVDILSIKDVQNKQTDIQNEYDYIYSDIAVAGANVYPYHGHTYMARIKAIPNKIYQLIFFLGHYKQIKEEKCSLNMSKKLIAVGSIIKKDFIENYKINEDKIILSNVGFVPPEQCMEDKPKTAVKDEFVVSISAPGFVKKGGYRFLEALRIFHKRYQSINIKANIIYEKYETNLFLQLYLKFFKLNKIVQFVNKQSNIFDFYQKSHVFVYPSILETFGRVVPEAMYAKTPVIVGSNVGAADIIQDGINGFIFNSDKKASENLAKKLKEVYDKYNNLEEVIEKGYQTSLKITWDSFAENIFYGLYPELKKKVLDNE